MLVLITGNLIVPLLATITIASTIASTLAAIFLCGYQFDAFCAILVVMVVGLAVDYSVHFSHLYMVSAPGGTRFQKAQGALHGVGLSIIAGAITTVRARAPCFFPCAARHGEATIRPHDLPCPISSSPQPPD